jgi:transcriptional regulator with XRE-family HTH domain
MGFRENLKEELTYSDMLIKELSAYSGVGIRAIHSYLRENGSMPSADAAVNIARVLGVSVEYLVTGTEIEYKGAGNRPVLSPAARAAARIVEQLGKKNQELSLTLLQSIKQFEENEKPTE